MFKVDTLFFDHNFCGYLSLFIKKFQQCHDTAFKRKYIKEKRYYSISTLIEVPMKLFYSLSLNMFFCACLSLFMKLNHELLFYQSVFTLTTVLLTLLTIALNTIFCPSGGHKTWWVISNILLLFFCLSVCTLNVIFYYLVSKHHWCGTLMRRQGMNLRQGTKSMRYGEKWESDRWSFVAY